MNQPQAHTIGKNPFLQEGEQLIREGNDLQESEKELQRNLSFETQLKKIVGRVKIGDFQERIDGEEMPSFWRETAAAINTILEAVKESRNDELETLQSICQELTSTSETIVEKVGFSSELKQTVLQQCEQNQKKTENLQGDVKQIQTELHRPSKIFDQKTKFDMENLQSLLQVAKINLEVAKRKENPEESMQFLQEFLYQFQLDLQMTLENLLGKYKQMMLQPNSFLNTSALTNLERLSLQLEHLQENFSLTSSLVEKSLPDLIENIQQEAENIKRLSTKISKIPEKFT
ncbi:MAG: hypothetical protein AAF564_05475 [Bacteroidota bacterium]